MYTYSDKSHIPQLRVLITSKCNSHCIYCRPGGETFLTNSQLSAEEFVRCITKLSEKGISSIKISGGDPALREDLPLIIKKIKDIPNISYVELITRFSGIPSMYGELEKAGLDCINFSLDTVDKDKWIYINGRNDFDEYLDAIKKARDYKYKLKINSVICMTEFSEILDLIGFIQSLGGGTLKLLDLIDDIVDERRNKNYDFSKCLSPDYIISELGKVSDEIKTIYPPGGIGHPMKQFFLEEKVDVIVKTSQAGAYYHESCKSCRFFPCYDALMALRLTPDGKLQKCLLRSDNWFDMYSVLDNEDKLINGINNMLNNYVDAKFYTYAEIGEIRKKFNE